MFSELPLTAYKQNGIRSQIECNWNLGDLAASPNLAQINPELRIEFLPDGSRRLVDSAIRAAAAGKLTHP